MPSKTSTFSRLAIFSAASVVALACTFSATGCDSSTTSTPDGDGGSSGDGSGSENCATDGTGTISIVISGLPEGVPAKVSLSGAASADVTATTTLADRPAGSYTVKAERVAQPDPIVRTLFDPTVSTKTTFCLGETTETVTVSYAAIAPSNKLWSTGGSDSDVVGFAGADLGATGSPAAKVKVKGSVASGMGSALAFDRDGNLWTLGGSSAEAPLVRYAAADLGTSGVKTPDRQIVVTLSGCSPSLHSIAFDTTGALWVTNVCGDYVMRVAPEKLAASGSFEPTDADKAKMAGPRKIAFDKAGNMWVSSETAIKRFPVASLGATAAHEADFTLTTKTELDTLPPDALAFDAAGNLWATNFTGNAVFKLTPEQLTPAGATKEVIPSVKIAIDVGGLVENIAFDESGGLWLTVGNGKVGRFAPAQLTTSSDLAEPTVPATMTTSSDLGYSTALAFFPAAAGLPIYSRFE